MIKGKEVKTMYVKPEITPMGDAGQVIQGGLPKQINLESDGVTPRDASASEFDE